MTGNGYRIHDLVADLMDRLYTIWKLMYDGIKDKERLLAVVEESMTLLEKLRSEVLNAR